MTCPLTRLSLGLLLPMLGMELQATLGERSTSAPHFLASDQAEPPSSPAFSSQGSPAWLALGLDTRGGVWRLDPGVQAEDAGLACAAGASSSGEAWGAEAAAGPLSASAPFLPRHSWPALTLKPHPSGAYLLVTGIEVQSILRVRINQHVLEPDQYHREGERIILSRACWNQVSLGSPGSPEAELQIVARFPPGGSLSEVDPSASSCASPVSSTRAVAGSPEGADLANLSSPEPVGSPLTPPGAPLRPQARRSFRALALAAAGASATRMPPLRVRRNILAALNQVGRPADVMAVVPSHYGSLAATPPAPIPTRASGPVDGTPALPDVAVLGPASDPAQGQVRAGKRKETPTDVEDAQRPRPQPAAPAAETLPEGKALAQRTPEGRVLIPFHQKK